jgi:hypothetical protein
MEEKRIEADGRMKEEGKEEKKRVGNMNVILKLGEIRQEKGDREKRGK